jgi:hypothetical protein
MKQYTLTFVDTRDIQKYIFGTNNLQQNVGASYLVDCATRQWVVESLPHPHNVININAAGTDEKLNEHRIEEGGLAAELLYTGGGNAAILFCSQPLAVEFARCLTRKALLKAPGLNMTLAHNSFDWEEGSLYKALDQTKGILAKRKADQPASTPLLGLGVTAACVYTGLPAVGYDEGRLFGAEVEAKINAAKKANDRLEELLDLQGYEIPTNFEELGRTKGESSYIAIVHSDGNRMGERIMKYTESNSSSNRSLIRALRNFSNSIEQTFLEALRETTSQLVESVEKDEKTIAGVIELQEDKLPFRPIVFGGDDLTFVCDGRLGLALTTHYLRELAQKKLVDNMPVHCRAGVAVVKTRFPFARGYALAEALCASAKRRITELRERREGDVTALDWHFATAGLLDDLETIRNREYTVRESTVQEDKLLYLRPVSLNCAEDWRSWANFERIIQEFKDEPWQDRRNKVKALREILRTGSDDAVEYFLTAHSMTGLPDIPEMPDMKHKGWQGKRCGYFDAIEAMDFYIPLKGGQEK